MKIKHFFDQDTFTLTYVVSDTATNEAVVIDPVLNYEPHASTFSYESNEQVESYINDNSLNLKYILETHAHADHITGSQDLKRRFPHAKVGIGAPIKIVQETFKEVFNLKHLPVDGSQFDLLLDESSKLKIGNLTLETIYTPGHTPACATYKIANSLFTGDALFMPDFGTGRCDFPKGSAKELYNSIHEKLYKFPDETKVYVGHDYGPGGRPMQFETTIGESKLSNIQLKEETTYDEFVDFRTKRDASLKAPKLLLQSIQVNIDAGHLPPAEDNGQSYLKFPLKKLTS